MQVDDTPTPMAEVEITATPEPIADPLPRTGGAELMAFYSNRAGNIDIYLMNLDSGMTLRLTDHPADDDSPAISPDGSCVVFLSARNDPNPSPPNLLYDIFIIGADGSGLQQLTDTSAAEDHPAWSPDGQSILFDADYDGDGYYEIYSMDATGGNPQRLTNNSANEQFADWSPDGSRIAFASDRNGNWDIFSMNADGTGEVQLTSSADYEVFPAWSPDGSRIAFTGLVPNSRDTDVYVMNADGTGLRQLTETRGFDESPTWSPDGSRIAFQTRRDGNFEIYTMMADGSDPQPFDPQTSGELWPSWSVQAAPRLDVQLVFEKSPQNFYLRETFQPVLIDLDTDGDLDAFFANPMQNPATVWLNDGSGTFSDTGQQLTSYGHGVALADFDWDGDPDAFVVCHQFSNPSRVYLNDGTGTFTDSGQVFDDAGQSAVEANLLDLNMDGNWDVHVVYFDPSGIPDRVYLNDGKANFTDSGLRLDEEVIAWADLDGDSDVDYFAKRQGTGYAVMLNDGSGNFSPGWEMTDALATVGGIALADFDGDGDKDVLVANGFRSSGAQPSRLFWNDGTGNFSNSGQVLNATLGAELTVGDLDSDGRPDVFVSNMDLPNEIWLNRGGWLLDSGLRLGEKTDMSGKASPGDVDGDGDTDVIVGRFRGGAEIWINQSVP
jgi:Tol biopolymer transport system component